MTAYEIAWNMVMGESRSARDVAREFEFGSREQTMDWVCQGLADAYDQGADLRTLLTHGLRMVDDIWAAVEARRDE